MPARTDDNAALREAHCWFDVDRVPGDPETTAWKRCARLRQAMWRADRSFARGTQPYAGGPDATPVGSRLDLSFAQASGANFITPGALAAVQSRLGAPEQYQTLREDRLWADLLSSMPLCFNLFGGLTGGAARRAVDVWWPQAPQGDVQVRFEHSPGRRDPSFLGNQSAFDVALEINGSAIIGIETKYHEHANVEDAPRQETLARYVEVTERSEVFVNGWREQIVGTALQQIWLDHLLVLSMLQHPSRRWSWGRFVLVYPSENPSFAAAATEYRALLRDTRTFESRTIEELLDAPGALDGATVNPLRARYLAQR